MMNFGAISYTSIRIYSLFKSWLKKFGFALSEFICNHVKLDYLQEKVLYFDIDSIIYVDDRTKNVKTGNMLGDMADELSGKEITNFFSTGPK